MSSNPSYIIPEEKGKCELCGLNYDFESEVCQECFKDNTKINLNPIYALGETVDIGLCFC